MDSEKRESPSREDLLLQWSEPFIKGLMFGIGHFIAYKIVGAKLRQIFKPALKNN
jgi:hypothetical protein